MLRALVSATEIANRGSRIEAAISDADGFTIFDSKMTGLHREYFKTNSPLQNLKIKLLSFFFLSISGHLLESVDIFDMLFQGILNFKFFIAQFANEILTVFISHMPTSVMLSGTPNTMC